MGYPVLALEVEADPDGVWISYGVRMMLDLVGMKIGLSAWQGLYECDRRLLCSLTGETEREIARFDRALRASAGRARVRVSELPEAKRARVADWKHGGPPPAVVAALLDAAAGAPAWRTLDRFGRYLACAFSRKADSQLLARALGEAGYRA